MVQKVFFSRFAAIEWPTVALALTIYGGWLALTFWHEKVPIWLLMPLGAWLIAWHSSLQHEVIHGHPTRWPRINAAIGFPPLSLWLPFHRYRALHLAHHRDERLTDPTDDPESSYWTRQSLHRQPWLVRRIIAVNATFVGRVLIGPPWVVCRFLMLELTAIRNGDRRVAGVWTWHIVGMAAVLTWISTVCHLQLWQYGCLFIWPGVSLMLIRSFAEHRAHEDVGRRTALVERAPVFGLLFLFNNLHVVHHMRPRMPWYRIPGWYAAHRTALVSRNGGLVYRGYLDVARRFLLRPHDVTVHPLRGH